MGFRILSKAEIQEYIEKEAKNLIVEIWHQSRPEYYLKRLGGRRPETIARVPKNIFSWFNLIDCEEQPLGINVSWKIFEEKKYE